MRCSCQKRQSASAGKLQVMAAEHPTRCGTHQIQARLNHKCGHGAQCVYRPCQPGQRRAYAVPIKAAESRDWHHLQSLSWGISYKVWHCINRILTLGKVFGDAVQSLHHGSQGGPGVACLAAGCDSAAALCLPRLIMTVLRLALPPVIVRITALVLPVPSGRPSRLELLFSPHTNNTCSSKNRLILQGS